MRGNSNGFTLLEILVAIALIMIMAAMVIPNFTRLQPRYEREQFISEFQALVQFGWQSALATGKVHRVHFDLNPNKRIISLGIETGTYDKKGEPEFKRLSLPFARSSMTWPAHIQFKNVIIEGFDEMGRYGAGRKITETWFYFMPDGLAQAVTINALDTKDLKNNKPRAFTLMLSPFNGQLRVV